MLIGRQPHALTVRRASFVLLHYTVYCGKGSAEGRPALTPIGPANTTSELDNSQGGLPKTPGGLSLTFRARLTNIIRGAEPNHNELLPLGPPMHLPIVTNPCEEIATPTLVVALRDRHTPPPT